MKDHIDVMEMDGMFFMGITRPIPSDKPNIQKRIGSGFRVTWHWRKDFRKALRELDQMEREGGPHE
jgi:hypothetical protein